MFQYSYPVDIDFVVGVNERERKILKLPYSIKLEPEYTYGPKSKFTVHLALPKTQYNPKAVDASRYAIMIMFTFCKNDKTYFDGNIQGHINGKKCSSSIVHFEEQESMHLRKHKEYASIAHTPPVSVQMPEDCYNIAIVLVYRGDNGIIEYCSDKDKSLFAISKTTIDQKDEPWSNYSSKWFV